MRTRFTLLFAFTCLLIGHAQSDESLLEQALFNMPDVAFRKISQPGDTVLQYALTIRQPLDHQHSETGHYGQQVILTHRGFDRPTVMNINGYSLYKAKNEVVQMLGANEINIEYRFFGESKPADIPWEYLTYDQVTADLHRINGFFRQLYSGKWVSTGISRGGQTAIIYRYYYPQDVDLSVPYVAPIINGIEDKRIYGFLDTMGTEDCRNRILAFQVYLLKHEREILEKLAWYSRGKELTYNYLGSLGKAFEYAVLEYPFSFWQTSELSCDQIPGGQTVDDYVNHLLAVVDPESFADKSMLDFEVHYYQSVTEGGYYGYDARPLQKHLKYIDVPNPSGSFPPKSATYEPFDGTLMNRIMAWLEEHGHHFIYIYGGRDTWSACRVNVTPEVQSVLFMVPGANHFKARVKYMPEAMQHEFADSFKRMAGLEVDLGALK